MAENKHRSQAERAASSAKLNSKKTKSHVTRKNSKESVEKTAIPIRLISSVICLALFIVFLVTFLQPEGALIELIEGVILGLIGQTGFLVSIPVLLYLFIIHAFSGKRPIQMRTISLVSFVLICGCFAHFILNPQNLPKGMKLLIELWVGGIEGTTGGFICGGIAMLIQGLLGPVIPKIVLFVAAIFTLLGGMQITLPSIIRAFQNRPRADWEDDEQEERQEPAALVVNHLANKRIAYIERQRQARKAMEEEEEDDTEESLPLSAPTPRASKKNADAIIRQIDSDVDNPVTAAVGKSKSEATSIDPEIIPISAPKPTIVIQPIKGMPPLEKEYIAAETEEIQPLDTSAVKKEKVTARDAENSAAEVWKSLSLKLWKNPSIFFPLLICLRFPLAAEGMAQWKCGITPAD